MVTSDFFLPEVEIWPFRVCAMKNMQFGSSCGRIVYELRYWADTMFHRTYFLVQMKPDLKGCYNPASGCYMIIYNVQFRMHWACHVIGQISKCADMYQLLAKKQHRTNHTKHYEYLHCRMFHQCYYM